MVEDKLKSILGELLMQNAVLSHQVEELNKQLTVMQQPKEEPNEG